MCVRQHKNALSGMLPSIHKRLPAVCKWRVIPWWWREKIIQQWWWREREWRIFGGRRDSDIHAHWGDGAKEPSAVLLIMHCFHFPGHNCCRHHTIHKHCTLCISYLSSYLQLHSQLPPPTDHTYGPHLSPTNANGRIIHHLSSLYACLLSKTWFEAIAMIWNLPQAWF